MFNVRQFDARTVAWWADQRPHIDFEPPYQRRGGLWSRRDKAFLIDSILNQYDIPKIYLADFTFGPSPLNETSRNFAVIDGKQRFEAIYDFLEGNVTLLDDFMFVEQPELNLGGLSYRDLKLNHPAIASRFDNYNLTIMSVITDEEGRINELFVRLNRNKTLTGPEIRNAMRGEVPGIIRTIAAHNFFRRVTFATARGQDLDVAAKFLLVEFHGRLVETKRWALDRFVEAGSSAEATPSDFHRAARRVSKALDAMELVFTNKDPLLRTQGQLVPYYWLVRSTDEARRRLVRPFLVTFEEIRRVNRRMATNPAQLSSVDATFSRYDALSRSINDPGSIEGRYEILTAFFGRYGSDPGRMRGLVEGGA